MTTALTMTVVLSPAELEVWARRLARARLYDELHARVVEAALSALPGAREIAVTVPEGERDALRLLTQPESAP